jgi:trehalose 6-phosphate synthase/phosphatase
MTSCRRILGLGENVGAGPAGGVLSINLGHRLVTITVSHVGIDLDVHLHRLRQPSLQAAAAALRDKYVPEGRKAIGGIEMLNQLQGADLKMLAYEELLNSYPIWRSKLTMLQVWPLPPLVCARTPSARLLRLVLSPPPECFTPSTPAACQVCFPDRDWPEESAAYGRNCREIATRIQAAYGQAAMTYLVVGEELPHWGVNDRLALLSVLDVYLNTATRDGLSLLPFEYVLAQTGQPAAAGADGMLVLSEFVGSAHVLNGAMRINPFNLEHVVEQVDHALAMPPDERAARLAKDHDFVAKNTMTSWLKVAVHDMRRVRSSHLGSPLAQMTRAVSSFPGGIRKGDPLPRLSMETVARAYRLATRRVILLGLDGTLIQQEKVCLLRCAP